DANLSSSSNNSWASRLRDSSTSSPSKISSSPRPPKLSRSSREFFLFSIYGSFIVRFLFNLIVVHNYCDSMRIQGQPGTLQVLTQCSTTVTSGAIPETGLLL